ncbi:MAG: glycosyltransferase [Paraburkholderia sp.]|uniref:glycosyltransferase n=2 Tax=Burkholderiales TaxID=80840 RepID=UPI0010F8A455|nr:glycosyltransferase [Burkholderia sp. 4M9327F10]
MTTLLIVEPEATGHRMVLYVRLIAENALRRGWKVTLMTTASALAHPAGRMTVSALGRDLDVAMMPEIPRGTHYGRLQLLLGQRAYLRAVEQGYIDYRKTRIADFVYVPYLNYFDKVAGFYGSPFGDTPFGGMILAARFHHHACGIAGPTGMQDVVNNVLFRRLLGLSKLALATTIDEPLPQYVMRKMPNVAGKIRYVPDTSFIGQPADRHEARRALGLEEGHFVVAAYGALSPRKGLARLLTLFSAADLPKYFRLVLAGVQDKEAAQMIQSFMLTAGERASQVIVLNRFCSELEEGQVFAAADSMWLCYENFSGMSGVLIQAAQAGVPVITSNYGLIDNYRGKRLLGLRWDDFLSASAPKPRFDWAKLQSAMHSIRNSPQLARFASEHSPNSFGSNVIDAIAVVHGAGKHDDQ